MRGNRHVIVTNVVGFAGQAPADFYRGKQIALLVGFDPVAKTDLWAA